MISPTQTDPDTGTRQSFGLFLLVAAAILAVRIVSLWFNTSDLFFDEAQYWVWGKEPAFGYFSKPPLLAFIIGGFTGVCGDNEFCVRLPSALFHTATAVILYLAANRLFDKRTAFIAGITWLLLPAVSLSSTLISTDVPLLLCWSMALYAFIRLENNGGLGWAVLLALALGLGLNAKYAMAYFVLCAVVYGIFVREARSVLKSPLLWLAFAGGFAMLIPNILWNLQNDFVTASHTGDNIGWGGGFPHLDRLAEFVGSQFGVVGPIVFGVYLIALFRFIKEGADRREKMLVAFSLPVLLLICVQAIMSKAFANWAATAFPALVILVSNLFVHTMPAIWERVSRGIHLVVFAILSVAVAFAAPGQLPLNENQNPFSRMWGGTELGEIVRAELANGSYTHVLSDSRKRSATLIYYLRDTPIEVLAWREGEHPGDHFELTRALQKRSADQLSDAVFLYPSYSGKVGADLRAAFERVTEVDKAPRFEGADKMVTLYRLEGYRGGK